MSLWTSADLARVTSGQVRGGDWTIDGISIDTRTLVPGDLFVALTAARDGHDFVAQALEKGAAGALVTHVPEGVAPDAPLLVVPDVQLALDALGRAGRDRMTGRVVAVTGSVGKTSTKEMLRTVLERQGSTHAAEASYNNQWGVPLTLARMPADTEFAVIEIGMNHPGEIAPLARMTRPHVALITNVAAVHMEAFESLAGIAREKAAIFDGLEPGGTCIVNGDMPPEAHGPILDAAHAAAGDRGHVVRFGSAPGCAYRLNRVDLGGASMVLRADMPGGEQLMKISTLGRHFAGNALATLAAVEALGADVTLAARDIALWIPPPGRGRAESLVLDPVENASVTLFDDAFNASPTSMRAAFEVLAAASPVDATGRIAKGRRIAILGDMLELGPDEVNLHRALADLPGFDRIDRVHCVGPLMRALWERLDADQQGEWVETAPEMAARARTLVDSGDVVLVKGSKGSRVSLVVDALRKLRHPLAVDSRRDE